MTERWKPVLGYEGYYEVSDAGRVRSIPRVVQSRIGWRQDVPGRVISISLDNHGRPHVRLYRDGGVKSRRVHTLVLEAFRGPRPEKLVGCHNDGDRGNNSLTNLRWDTYRENNLDAVRHGTHVLARRTHCGEGHPLTPVPSAVPRRRCLVCAAVRRREIYDPAKRAARYVTDQLARKAQERQEATQ